MQNSKRTNITLWVLQGFFALFFGLASGLPKLLLPQAMLGMPLALPDVFIKCIGVGELLGAIGLIVPGLVGVRPGLTALAAAGLAFVALSASVYQVLAAQPGNAVFAFVLALIMAGLAYARWRIVPLRARTQAPPAALLQSALPITLTH